MAFSLPMTAGGCEDDACLTERLESSPVRLKSFWESYKKSSISQRVFAAPDELVQYLSDENKLTGYADGVSSVQPDHPFLQKIKLALSGLPKKVLAAIDPKLVAIVLVNKLGSTGFGDIVKGDNDQATSGYIVLDVESLSRTANVWASWKDSTAFDVDKNHRIVTTIASRKDDNVLTAIQFILLHEMGHILSIGENFHPLWSFEPEKMNLDSYPFSQLSWTKSENGKHYMTKNEALLDIRKTMIYYQSTSVAKDKFLEAFELIKASGFNSLYSATNIWDDFAESFVIYVWTELLNRPFKQELFLKGVQEALLESCLSDSCSSKAEIIRNHLASFE